MCLEHACYATPCCAGQRVTAAPFPATRGQGTWQQYVSVSEEHVLAVPDNVSDEAAAQFLVGAWRIVGVAPAAVTCEQGP